MISKYKMKRNKTIYGVIALLISQVLVKVFGLVYKIYLANKTGFGDVGNAIYNSGYQIYALLLTISSIGVPAAVAKLIAENRNDKKEMASVLKNAVVVFSIIGAVGSITLALGAKYISKNLLDITEAEKSIIALSPAVFNVCIISVFKGYFNGINMMETTAKSQTIEQILKTVFTIVFVEIAYILFMGNTTNMAAFANFATTIATFGSLIFLYSRAELKSVKINYSYKKMLKILYVSIPISLSAILASLSKSVDSVTIVRILKNYLGEEMARAQYGVLTGKVDLIASVPISFVIAIATSVIPSITLLRKQNNYSKIRKISRKYIQYTLFVVLPCCIIMFMFPKEILRLLFKSENGYVLLRIGSISMIFVALEQIINSILQAMGCIFVPAIALGIGVIIKLFFNLRLLNISPEYWYGGINGSAIATLACHIVAVSIGFVVMNTRVKRSF